MDRALRRRLPRVGGKRSVGREAAVAAAPRRWWRPLCRVPHRSPCRGRNRGIDRDAREMNVRRFWVALFAAILFAGSPAQAQGEGNRSAVLDHLGRGMAAFRAGDSVTATEQWSEAIRLAHQIGDADLEGQALARRGEAYRIAGSLNDAGDDLRAALAEAEVSGDQPLIAAASGAMGSVELVRQHPDAAEKLLTRSLDLARRLGDRQIVASSSNDLGNLYLASGRLAQAARVYADADANPQAIGDPVLIATTEINSARLASQQGEPAVAALLTRAVVRLERAAPSYNGGLALITAGALALERDGSWPNGPSARPRPMPMRCTMPGSRPSRMAALAISTNTSAALTKPRASPAGRCFRRSKAPLPNCRSAGIGSRPDLPCSRDNTARL